MNWHFKRMINRLCSILVIGLVVLTMLGTARAEFSVGGDVPDLHPDVAILFEKVWQAYNAKNLFAIPGLLRQVQQKAREVGDKSGEVLSLYVYAEMFHRLNLPQKAAEYEVQAHEVMSSAGDKNAQARILSSLGMFYRAVGKNEQALEFFQEALKLRRESGDKSGQADVLILLGTFHFWQLNQPQAGMGLFHQALDMSREIGDKSQEAASLYRIGQALYSPNTRPKALDSLQQALQIWRSINDRSGQAAALAMIGEIHSANEPEQALKAFEEAVAILDDIKSRQSNTAKQVNLFALYSARHREAQLLEQLSNVYRTLKQPQRSVEVLEQAMQLMRENGDRRREALALMALGATQRLGLKQIEAARISYEKAANLHQEIGDEASASSAFASLAEIETEAGRFDEAEAWWRKSLASHETARARIGANSTDKITYVERNVWRYHVFVDFLLRREKVTEAFTWAEKTKARTLLDLMQGGKVEIASTLSDEEQATEKQLREQVEQLNTQLIAATASRFADAGSLKSLKARLIEAEKDWQRFTATLYATHPELTVSRVANTSELPDVVKWLPADTALLNYVVLQGKESQIALFVVTLEESQPILKQYLLGKADEELLELIDDFQSACADPKKNYKGKARELFQKLLAPAASQLRNKTRLLICPDAVLWSVPFGALMVEDNFLLERYDIAYAYSATAMQAALQRNSTQSGQAGRSYSLLALANPDFGGPERLQNQKDTQSKGERPITAEGKRAIEMGAKAVERGIMRGDGAITPLPGTQTEAEAIKSIFSDAVMLTGDKAQETTLKAQSPNHRILHLATHGLFNDAVPLQSSIILAQPAAGSTDDGFLTAREIFDLNWKATNLVVLSACETGRGKAQRGEGVLGLTWALFVAGAPSQIVSQWKVHDVASAELMKRFYTHLKAGKGKSESLRNAELELLALPEYSHPYFWAPFVLMGEWR